ncbi:MAG: hypothetical protein O2794_02580 [bacterium]|nr:hypothetical protein [bacterium]
MKIYIYILSVVLAGLPLISSAHSNTAKTTQPGSMMMREIEDRVLGDEAHENHEQLMIKMMSGGNLSEGEIQEMIDFMDTNPGVHSMMMNRLNEGEYRGHMSGFSTNNYNHMFGGTYWITVVLLWGVLGLALIALGKNVLKK